MHNVIINVLDLCAVPFEENKIRLSLCIYTFLEDMFSKNYDSIVISKDYDNDSLISLLNCNNYNSVVVNSLSDRQVLQALSASTIDDIETIIDNDGKYEVMKNVVFDLSFNNKTVISDLKKINSDFDLYNYVYGKISYNSNLNTRVISLIPTAAHTQDLNKDISGHTYKYFLDLGIMIKKSYYPNNKRAEDTEKIDTIPDDLIILGFSKYEFNQSLDLSNIYDVYGLIEDVSKFGIDVSHINKESLYKNKYYFIGITLDKNDNNKILRSKVYTYNDDSPLKNIWTIGIREYEIYNR